MNCILLFVKIIFQFFFNNLFTRQMYDRTIVACSCCLLRLGQWNGWHSVSESVGDCVEEMVGLRGIDDTVFLSTV